MFFIRLFLANTWEKSGVTVLVSQTAVKKEDIVLRSQSGWIIWAAGTGARYKIMSIALRTAMYKRYINIIIIIIVFEVRTRDQACFRLF